jgi:hypothetical protein
MSLGVCVVCAHCEQFDFIYTLASDPNSPLLQRVTGMLETFAVLLDGERRCFTTTSKSAMTMSRLSLSNSKA